MTVFLVLMMVGLAGLVLMALPGLTQGHALGTGGHMPLGGAGLSHLSAGHEGISGALGLSHSAGDSASALGGAVHGAGSVLVHAQSQMPATVPQAGSPLWLGALHLVPSPRAVFSFLAIYGACGYALIHSGTLGVVLAALVALVPAVAVERLIVTPLWNLCFRFQGIPTTALETLVLVEAEAITPFHNGRGIVQVEHDGRMIQLTAHLVKRQVALPVDVGNRVLIEDVDPEHERVAVSLL
jgi:hypothetical protein